MGFVPITQGRKTKRAKKLDRASRRSCLKGKNKLASAGLGDFYFSPGICCYVATKQTNECIFYIKEERAINTLLKSDCKIYYEDEKTWFYNIEEFRKYLLILKLSCLEKNE